MSIGFNLGLVLVVSPALTKPIVRAHGVWVLLAGMNGF